MGGVLPGEVDGKPTVRRTAAARMGVGSPDEGEVQRADLTQPHAPTKEIQAGRMACMNSGGGMYEADPDEEELEQDIDHDYQNPYTHLDI